MNAPRSGCPINLTLEALGDRWSLIVIRDLMFGNRRHFRELLTRSEERIASNILADRLTRLEKAGLVSRRDDPSHKQKVIYSVTEASIALVPLLYTRQQTAVFGAPGRIRTHDPLVRSQVLYPTELRARFLTRSDYISVFLERGIMTVSP
jgi:DNA-binding HxlR family transcriptional regulator